MGGRNIHSRVAWAHQQAAAETVLSAAAARRRAPRPQVTGTCPDCKHAWSEHEDEGMGCLHGWGEAGVTGCFCPRA